MKKNFILSTIVLAALTLSQNSWAYYSTMDTGDLIAPNKYRVGAETQFITDEDSGVNIIGRFDKGFNDEMNFKAELGFGTTDFHLGGYVKWIPIPDYENQPAIGVTSGLLFAQYDSETEISIRIHPMISKGFDVEFGRLTPYASAPTGLRTFDGDTDIPLQVNFGSDVYFQELQYWHFKAEVGFDVSEAFTYISFGASLDFDEENGIQFR